MEKKIFSILVFVMFLATVGGANASEGLVSYWDFNEGTGTIAVDSVGENDGTIINDPTWTGGVCGNALDFDGVDDFVNVVDAPSLNITNDLTLSLFLKKEGDRDYLQAPIFKGYTKYEHITSDAYGIFIWPNGSIHLRFGIPSPHRNYDCITPETIENDIWYHIAATYDQQNMKVYIDGELKISCPATASMVNNSAPFSIGARYSGYNDGYYSWHFDGLIDEASVYNRALSEDEINAIYQNPCPDAGDANKGHGNDPDGVDEDNPGKGCEKKNATGNRDRC